MDRAKLSGVCSNSQSFNPPAVHSKQWDYTVYPLQRVDRPNVAGVLVVAHDLNLMRHVVFGEGFMLLRVMLLKKKKDAVKQHNSIYQNNCSIW